MNEKVILPREVCAALDLLLSKGFSVAEIVFRTYQKNWVSDETIILNQEKHGASEIAKALILGYEHEKTPEEKARAAFENIPTAVYLMPSFKAYQLGLIDGLKLAGRDFYETPQIENS